MVVAGASPSDSIIDIADIADFAPHIHPPAPGTPLPHVDINQPGRNAVHFEHWARAHSNELGIPVQSMQAYGNAARVMEVTNPACGISWTTLAGIGAIESWHGTYEGATINEHGQVEPPIRGIPLDGRPGIAEIPDTDGGELDGDTEFDRAMGPMQFIPSTWRIWGSDGNGNGHADPDNLEDATLSAARYLCASGGDLRNPVGWRTAILAYNFSEEYLEAVHERAVRYSRDVYVPEPPPPPAPPVEHHEPEHHEPEHHEPEHHEPEHHEPEHHEPEHHELVHHEPEHHDAENPEPGHHNPEVHHEAAARVDNGPTVDQDSADRSAETLQRLNAHLKNLLNFLNEQQ
ncbi:lytic murein transglycosylase [Hoyosella rhizosphaerae]|nr:lytic murein transglycosylase [Hoyosella rhizosphaerae]